MTPAADIPWDDDLAATFAVAKDALADTCQLTHFLPQVQLCLHIDALDVGLSGALEQLDAGR